MDKRLLKEILAAHADQLVKGKATGKDYLTLLPEQDGELAPLLNMAERLQSTLKPIAPTNSFEQALKQDLLDTAHLHQTEGYIPPNPSRDLFILMTTAAFIVSLTIAIRAFNRQNLSLWQIYQIQINKLQQTIRS